MMQHQYTLFAANEARFSSIPEDTKYLTLSLDRDLQWKEGFLTNLKDLSTLTIEGMGNVKDLDKMRLTIEVLYVSNQGLTSIPDLSNLTNLTTLNVSNNLIECLKGVDNIPTLTRLLANYNRIWVIKYIDHVKHVKLDHNRISSLSLISGDTLTTLSVNNNQIENISTYTKPNKSLLELDIKNNQLEEIDIQCLVNLDRLDVSGNRIRTLKMRKTHGLSSLTAHDTLIRDLYGVQDYPNLNRLSLNYRDINRIYFEVESATINDTNFDEKIIGAVLAHLDESFAYHGSTLRSDIMKLEDVDLAYGQGNTQVLTITCCLPKESSVIASEA